MREEYNDYDDTRYDDEYGYEDQQAIDNKAVRGYRIVIIILAVILVALSVVYFNMHRQQQTEYALLEEDRTKIKGDLDSLIVSFDDLKIQNDSIASSLEEANKIMEQLKNERRLNYAKIRQYQKEVGTLRTVMQGYIRQIDSLNTINKKLTKENISYKKEISSAQLRAEMAEERAEELNNKVRVGSVIRARSIGIEMLNAKKKPVSRVKQAGALRVNFVLGGNELAEPGQKTVYLCITSPDGYLLSTDAMPTFVYQGVKKGYSESREVDYQNEDVDVSIFYKGSGFIPGTYKIELYMDGNKVGGTEVAVK
jgi:predicted RNase H-like nuclease (RuvC/YqgF family)